MTALNHEDALLAIREHEFLASGRDPLLPHPVHLLQGEDRPGLFFNQPRRFPCVGDDVQPELEGRILGLQGPRINEVHAPQAGFVRAWPQPNRVTGTNDRLYVNVGRLFSWLYLDISTS